MIAVSTPRRRWVGETDTHVTPAHGTTAPGTVSSKLYIPEVATARSPSHSASERSSSAYAGGFSHPDGTSSAKASKSARVKRGHSSGVTGRSASASSLTAGMSTGPLPGEASGMRARPAAWRWTGRGAE
jgi:hypothetical protein